MEDGGEGGLWGWGWGWEDQKAKINAIIFGDLLKLLTVLT